MRWDLKKESRVRTWVPSPCRRRDRHRRVVRPRRPHLVELREDGVRPTDEKTRGFPAPAGTDLLRRAHEGWLRRDRELGGPGSARAPAVTHPPPEEAAAGTGAKTRRAGAGAKTRMPSSAVVCRSPLRRDPRCAVPFIMERCSPSFFYVQCPRASSPCTRVLGGALQTSHGGRARGNGPDRAGSQVAGDHGFFARLRGLGEPGRRVRTTGVEK